MLQQVEEKREEWYALYTSPRAEKRVQERLMAFGIENWLPLHRCPRTWSDRVKMVDMPLFPSYIFVRCTEAKLAELYRIYGVVRAIYFEGHPAIVYRNEIDAIKEFLQIASCKQLLLNDEAEILCGPLKHVTGKVQKIKGQVVRLCLDQLGITVSVKLSEIAPTVRFPK
ncbi:MAG: UpxY family transcription antiterminator [Tannerellaceae bacterium]|jgi:transcription antitermination factor NusG|nr:UpxY family transcription antiterminator [Tannerellaceae bacterium]